MTNTPTPEEVEAARAEMETCGCSRGRCTVSYGTINTMLSALSTAESEIQRLTLQVESAGADTKRLDWLERNPRGCATRHMREWVVTDPSYYATNHHGATLRDAIDAAITKSTTNREDGV